MYVKCVRYSNVPAIVTKLIHPDGVAEYRLTRNVIHGKDNEGNDVIQGEEVYFEVTPGDEQPSLENVEDNFDIYWNSGSRWSATNNIPKTIEERLKEIEIDNVTALEGIAELYEMMMQ